MVGFWFDEKELAAFDRALVKANYVKPNGTANRADYLKDAAKAVVLKEGSQADKKLFEDAPKAAKPKAAKKPTKSKAKKSAKKTEKVLATKGVGAVG